MIEEAVTRAVAAITKPAEDVSTMIERTSHGYSMGVKEGGFLNRRLVDDQVRSQSSDILVSVNAIEMQSNSSLLYILFIYPGGI